MILPPLKKNRDDAFRGRPFLFVLFLLFTLIFIACEVENADLTIDADLDTSGEEDTSSPEPTPIRCEKDNDCRKGDVCDPKRGFCMEGSSEGSDGDDEFETMNESDDEPPNPFLGRPCEESGNCPGDLVCGIEAQCVEPCTVTGCSVTEGKCNHRNGYCEFCENCRPNQCCNFQGGSWRCGACCRPLCGPGTGCQMGECIDLECPPCRKNETCSAFTGYQCVPLPPVDLDNTTSIQRPRALAFSSDGHYVALSGCARETIDDSDPENLYDQIPLCVGGFVDVYPAGEAAPIKSLNLGHASVSALAYSPRGRWLATVDEIGQVRILNAISLESFKHFQVPPEEAYALSFSPDGSLLSVSGKTKRIYNSPRQRQDLTLIRTADWSMRQLLADRWLFAASFGADAEELLVVEGIPWEGVYPELYLLVLDTRTGKPSREFKATVFTPYPIYRDSRYPSGCRRTPTRASASISPSGGWLQVGGGFVESCLFFPGVSYTYYYGTGVIYSLRAGEMANNWIFREHPMEYTLPAPDGEWMVFAEEDHIYLHHVASSTPYSHVYSTPGWIDMAFSPTEPLLAVLNGNGLDWLDLSEWMPPREIGCRFDLECEEGEYCNRALFQCRPDHCADGLDNDLDGRTDRADPDCVFGNFELSPMEN